MKEALRTLEASRAKLRNAMAQLPAADRCRRAAPGRWSPVEIVEHVALVERRFARVLAERISDAKLAGLGPEGDAPRQPLPARLSGALADREARRDAPEPVHPSGSLDEPGAWAAIDASREELRAAVLAGDGLALSSVIYEHAYFGALNVYQWLEFVAGHEARHAEQVREHRAAAARA